MESKQSRRSRCLCVRQWACLLALGATTAVAQEKPKATCIETTRRVLKPYERALEAAEKGREHYLESNDKRIAADRAAIALRQSFRQRFEAYQRSESAKFAQRIEYAEAAIELAREHAVDRIRQYSEALAKAREKGRTLDVERLSRAIATIRGQLAAEESSAHQPKLAMSKSIRGWRGYIASQRAQQAKRAAQFAAGEVSMHMRELGRSHSWQSTRKSIADYRARLADALARKPTYHLPTLNRSFSGAGIDAELAKRKAALADAMQRIAAGTYALHVSALGRTHDRNGVQALIHQARERRLKDIHDWGRKEFYIHNPLRGNSVSNGALEEAISSLLKERAEYVALGNDATAHASGRHRSASDILASQAKARAAGNEKSANAWGKTLAEWRKNHAAYLLAWDKKIAHQRKALAKHEELWRASLQRQQQHIDGRLTLALAQTPCGGVGSGVRSERGDLIDRHLDKLDRLSENEAERRRRRDLYEDHIYRAPDGAVHGDPKDAWRNALRDLPIGDGQASIAQWLLWVKDNADWLQGFADAKALRDLTRQIDEFVAAMEALDPAKLSAKEFYAQRKKLRGLLVGLQSAVEGGIMSPARIEGYLAALKKSGGKSQKARQQLQALLQMKRRSTGARAMLRNAGVLRGVATNLSGEALTAYSNFVKGSADEVAGRLDDWIQGQSKLDRGLFVLSMAAAAANAYERTQQGMAPSEAIGRASADFVVDLVIGGVPVLAAAEMATQVLFVSYSAATGDAAVNDATLSSTAKWVVGRVLDGAASGGAALGRASVVLERMANGARSSQQILATVDASRVRAALARVEERIGALAPGHADEAGLLRSRRSLRQLLRAKAGRGH